MSVIAIKNTLLGPLWVEGEALRTWVGEEKTKIVELLHLRSEQEFQDEEEQRRGKRKTKQYGQRLKP